jgi:hypothetical protein
VLNKTILDNALNAEDSMTEKMATVLWLVKIHSVRLDHVNVEQESA